MDFAVVLLTADDARGTDPDSLGSRARQNVALEVGTFVGKLRRRWSACCTRPV